MGLFSKSPRDKPIDPAWIRAVGLVIAADAPPQGAPSRGPESQGRIRALVATPSRGRRQLHATFPFADTHWVAAGMEVPVALDPANADTFVVDWASVPPMQQQADANHPALADPFAASRANAAALGITPSAKTAATYQRLQQMVADVATKPAPPGSRRAVAVVGTIRGRYVVSGDDDGPTSSGVSLTANSAAVLSVTVPGQVPYAVYLPKFKFDRKHLSVPGEPMPALVAANDPHDVTILWAEVPGIDGLIAARMADSVQGNAALTATLAARFHAAQAAASAAYAPPPGGYPPPAGGNPPPAGGYPPPAPDMHVAGTMPPEIRQTLVDTLKRSLAAMPNPAQRQMVLDQYRAMGVDITQEELGF